MSEFQPGRILAERYKLVSVLGRGGMGSVWRAEHLMLGSEVAVKLIDPEIAKNPEAQARFVREARAAAALRSPHVVQILDFGVDENVPFIVMELMVGESLSDRLGRQGRLPPAETARIMTDVARALAKAHEAGIIHRDLKPDNVFLVENDDVEVAKVLDFGVARITNYSSDNAYSAANANMTSTGAVLGTPFYMSPEQAEGLKDVDHRTDIWALAVMTYECLVGDRPFQGDTLGGVFLAICARDIPVPSQKASVPPGFDAWFEKGAARSLDTRFRTVRDAAKQLRKVCLGEEAGRASLELPAAEVSPEGQRSTPDIPPNPQSTAQLGGSGRVDPLGASDSAVSVTGFSNTAAGLPRKRGIGPLAWWGAGISAMALLAWVVVTARQAESIEEPEEFIAAPTETHQPSAPRSPEDETASRLENPAEDPREGDTPVAQGETASPEKSPEKDGPSDALGQSKPGQSKKAQSESSVVAPSALPRPRVAAPTTPVSSAASAAPSSPPKAAPSPAPKKVPRPHPAPTPSVPGPVDLGI